MKAMHEFARDSQLQRNVLNDPYLASNPKNRPCVLFKRFGVRQASWITENVSQEMFRKNNFNRENVKDYEKLRQLIMELK